MIYTNNRVFSGAFFLRIFNTPDFSCYYKSLRLQTRKYVHFKSKPHTKDLSRSVKNYGVLLRQKKISTHRKIYEKLTFFNLNQILYIPMIKNVYSSLVLYTIRYSNIPGIQLQLVLL